MEIEFTCLPSSQIKVFTTFPTMPKGTITINNEVARNKSTEKIQIQTGKMLLLLRHLDPRQS